MNKYKVIVQKFVVIEAESLQEAYDILGREYSEYQAISGAEQILLNNLWVNIDATESSYEHYLDVADQGDKDDLARYYSSLSLDHGDEEDEDYYVDEDYIRGLVHKDLFEEVGNDILENSKDLDPEFSEIVDEKFWDLM